MNDAEKGAAAMDAVVYFLSGAERSPVNANHVLAPTTEVLRNQRRAVENAVGTTLDVDDEFEPLTSRSPSRANDRVLAQRRDRSRSFI